MLTLPRFQGRLAHNEALFVAIRVSNLNRPPLKLRPSPNIQNHNSQTLAGRRIKAVMFPTP